MRASLSVVGYIVFWVGIVAFPFVIVESYRAALRYDHRPSVTAPHHYTDAEFAEIMARIERDLTASEAAIRDDARSAIATANIVAAIEDTANNSGYR